MGPKITRTFSEQPQLRPPATRFGSTIWMRRTVPEYARNSQGDIQNDPVELRVWDREPKCLGGRNPRCSPSIDPLRSTAAVLQWSFVGVSDRGNSKSSRATSKSAFGAVPSNFIAEPIRGIGVRRRLQR